MTVRRQGVGGKVYDPDQLPGLVVVSRFGRKRSLFFVYVHTKVLCYVCVHASNAQGSLRLAIEVDGTESDSDIAALATLQPVVVLLNTAHSVSRLHASR